MEQLLKYLTSFGIPQEHAEKVAYKLLQPTDMKEALTRVYQGQYPDRDTAAAQAKRHLDTTAYLQAHGAQVDPEMAQLAAQAAALMARGKYQVQRPSPAHDEMAWQRNGGFTSSVTDRSFMLTPDELRERKAQLDERKYISDEALPVEDVPYTMTPRGF